jgi:hypothetical protein
LKKPDRRVTLHRIRERDVKRRCRFASAAILMLAAAATPLFAADSPAAQPSQYSLGDQTLSINAGLFVPLFLLPGPVVLLAPSAGSGSPPHLTLGAVGNLSWAAYVSPQIRLGLDIAGDFTLSPNANSLLMLPFIAKAAWVFTVYPFEIPVSFGVGMNIVKYVDKTSIDLLLRPGVSGLWIFNSSWSFGLNLNWWFDMMFAKDPTSSRIGNFLEVSLSALYHF